MNGDLHEPALATQDAPHVTPTNVRTRDAETNSARIIGELHELVAALDRRMPHVDRVGEVGIARAAAVLRSEALRRIDELERDARRRE